MGAFKVVEFTQLSTSQQAQIHHQHLHCRNITTLQGCHPLYQHAASTASDLDYVLSLNASVVLYMVHGGTSFGFQSGANTGAFSFDFQPDITSYDYVSFDLRTDG
jgi:hypothetical protein